MRGSKSGCGSLLGSIRLSFRFTLGWRWTRVASADRSQPHENLRAAATVLCVPCAGAALTFVVLQRAGGKPFDLPRAAALELKLAARRRRRHRDEREVCCFRHSHQASSANEQQRELSDVVCLGKPSILSAAPWTWAGGARPRPVWGTHRTLLATQLVQFAC